MRSRNDATRCLTVLWNTPSDTGGSAIVAYDLRHIPTDDDETDDANWTSSRMSGSPAGPP